MGRQDHLFVGEKKAPMGLNVELKHYGGELYEVFTNLSCVC